MRKVTKLAVPKGHSYEVIVSRRSFVYLNDKFNVVAKFPVVDECPVLVIVKVKLLCVLGSYFKVRHELLVSQKDSVVLYLGIHCNKLLDVVKVTVLHAHEKGR